CPVRYTWTASFGRRLMFWQKWFYLTPQFVAYQLPGHLLHPHWYFTAYSSICQVLLGALRRNRKPVLTGCPVRRLAHYLFNTGHNIIDICKVALAVSVIKYLNCFPRPQLISETKISHIRATSGAIH